MVAICQQTLPMPHVIMQESFVMKRLYWPIIRPPTGGVSAFSTFEPTINQGIHQLFAADAPMEEVSAAAHRQFLNLGKQHMDALPLDVVAASTPRGPIPMSDAMNLPTTQATDFYVMDPTLMREERAERIANALTGLPPGDLKNKLALRLLDSPSVGKQITHFNNGIVDAAGHSIVVSARADPTKPKIYPHYTDQLSVRSLPDAVKQVNEGLGHFWVEFTREELATKPIQTWARVNVVYVEGKSPRITMDLRLSNRQCEDIGTVSTDLGGQRSILMERALGSLEACGNAADLCKAYRQIMFDDVDRIFVFRLRGVFYKQLRLPMGYKHANYHLQDVLTRCLSGILEHTFELCADNLAGIYPQPTDAINAMLDLVDRCEKHQIVLDIDSLKVGARSIVHIGAEIGWIRDQFGFIKHPRSMVALVQPVTIATLADVQYFVCAMMFAGSQIPRLSGLLIKLRTFMQEHGGSSTTKRSELKKIKVARFWTAELQSAVEELQKAIDDQLICSALRKDEMLVIFSDADDNCHAAVLASFPIHQTDWEYDQRTYTPLQVSHGVFGVGDLHRHIHQKELQAMWQVCVDHEQLIRGSPGLLIYTDSTTAEGKASKLFAPNVMALNRSNRMAYDIGSLNARLYRIPGALNVIIDLLSRTYEPRKLDMQVVGITDQALEAAGVTSINVIGTRALERRGEPRPPSEQRLVAENAERQRRERWDLLGTATTRQWHRYSERAGAHIDVFDTIRANTDPDHPPQEGDVLDRGVWTRAYQTRRVIVVPDNPDLRKMILALGHGQGGAHPHNQRTLELIRRDYTWDSLRAEVTAWVARCIVCRMAKGPNRTRAPLGMATPSFGPFDTLAFDFADIGITALDGCKYALVMVDVFSLHLRIVPTVQRDALTAAKALIAYGADMLDPHNLWSDQGTHFVNETIRRVLELKGISQAITMANVEYTRGVIETSVRGVKNGLRTVCLAAGLNLNMWPSICAVVYSTSNNMIAEGSLQGYAPNDVIFGQHRLPVQVIVRDAERLEHVPLSDSILNHVRELQFELTRIQQEVEQSRYDDTNRNRRSRGAIKLPLLLGQDVLIAEAQPVNALVPRWSRLGTVKEVQSAWTYVIEELVDNRVTEQHISNLRPLDSACFRQNLSDYELIFWTALNRHGISKIDDFRMNNGFLQCHIVWATQDVSPSWENVSVWQPRLPRYFKALSMDVNFGEDTRARLRAMEA